MGVFTFFYNKKCDIIELTILYYEYNILLHTKNESFITFLCVFYFFSFVSLSLSFISLNVLRFFFSWRTFNTDAVQTEFKTLE